MRAPIVLFIALVCLSAVRAQGQCSNKWFINFELGVNGEVPTTNTMNGCVIGSSPYKWISMRSGVSHHIQDRVYFTNVTVYQTPTAASNVCDVGFTNQGVRALAASTDTNYNWKFVASPGTTGATAFAWIMWNAPEVENAGNYDVFTFYPSSGTNFANFQIVSLNGSWRGHFENPGGSDSGAFVTGLTTNTWYGVSLARAVGLTNMCIVWRTNGTILGAITSSVAPLAASLQSASNLCFGINSIAASEPGFHVYHKGGLIDWNGDSSRLVNFLADTNIPVVPPVTRMSATTANVGTIVRAQ